MPSCQSMTMMFFILVGILLFPSIYSNSHEEPCEFSDLSPPIQSILCAVERGIWKISIETDRFKHMECLLGKHRCTNVMKIPQESEVPPSPPPPNARNPQYQELALKAEKVVPKIWWRNGFANDQLLLSHNNDELPKKLFDSSSHLSNKKLKNIYQCITRQHFMRHSYDFQNYKNQPEQNNTLLLEGKMKGGVLKEDLTTVCKAMEQQVVQEFFKIWHLHRDDLDGSFHSSNDRKFQIWLPKLSNQGQLVMAASEVMEHFYMNYGGVWTGCFAYEKYPECRGALAAAALVGATQIIADIAGKQKSFTDTLFTKGYLLASVGRGLLHGDLSSTGNQYLTTWKVRLTDFIGLQAAFLKLYIDSYGKIYNQQLNQYIPFAFSGDFPVIAKRQWQNFSQSLEPVYSSVRNWMFTECSNLIDFSPYRPVVAFHPVRQRIMKDSQKTKRRRVLIDVGANGFYASPKFLIDHYSVYLPFTDVIMIEPEPHFSATIPPIYSQRYNISFLSIYAEVATGSKTDIIKLLPTLVNSNDFVVLKFDVDPNRYAYGPTMEWGFLFEIMQNPDVAMLVDEVYIELHFHFPSLFWKHYHSNWEALDTFRYLRNHGVIVHSWP